MRTLLIVALLGGTLSAQKAPRIDVPLNAEWIGTLQWEDSGGEKILPTIATLKIEGRSIVGTWRGPTPSSPSGSLAGKIDDKGQWRVTIELFGDADFRDVNGNVTETKTEGCVGKGAMVGTLFPTAVLRLTAKRIESDTDATRAKGRACDSPRNVVWLLQVRH